MMQNIMPNEINEGRKEKMKQLEEGLRSFIQGSSVGERVECPFCHYTSNKNKTSAVIFKDSIKCFSCGIWRKL